MLRHTEIGNGSRHEVSGDSQGSGVVSANKETRVVSNVNKKPKSSQSVVPVNRIIILTALS